MNTGGRLAGVPPPAHLPAVDDTSFAAKSCVETAPGLREVPRRARRSTVREDKVIAWSWRQRSEDEGQRLPATVRPCRIFFFVTTVIDDPGVIAACRSASGISRSCSTW